MCNVCRLWSDKCRILSRDLNSVPSAQELTDASLAARYRTEKGRCSRGYPGTVPASRPHTAVPLTVRRPMAVQQTHEEACSLYQGKEQVSVFRHYKFYHGNKYKPSDKFCRNKF